MRPFTFRPNALHRGYSTQHAVTSVEAGIAKILHTSKKIPDCLSPTPSHLLNLLFSDIFPSPGSSSSSEPPTPPSFPTSLTHVRSLPQGHHLVYFPLQTPPSGLMPDGTDPDHCPGAPFTRRLWAGGEVRFRKDWEDELSLDRRLVECIESVYDVRAEKRMVWVELWRRYGAASAGSCSKSPAIEERRTLAFLPEVDTPKPTRRSLKPPHKPTASLSLTPTQNLLTNFSALTYNAHAIHLNPAWAAKEGHAATLVHGPLSLALMLAFLNGLGNGQSVRWYGYRNLAPLYCGREMKLCVREKEAARVGSENERRWDVWIEAMTVAWQSRGLPRLLTCRLRVERDDGMMKLYAIIGKRPLQEHRLGALLSKRLL